MTYIQQSIESLEANGEEYLFCRRVPASEYGNAN